MAFSKILAASIDYPVGAILQIVETSNTTPSSTTTTIPLDDTVPQNTEGAEYTTASITPKETMSKIIVDVTGYIGCTAAVHAILALFKDSDASAFATTALYLSTAGAGQDFNLRGTFTAGTLSPITVKLRFDPSNGTSIGILARNGAAHFGSSDTLSIKLTEIKV
jgi:hypothetical protein